MRSAKKDVVEEALRRFDEMGVNTRRPVMIGDRDIDVGGAGHHDVPTIFVRWGYGAPAEEVGAIGVVDDTEQLEKLLFA